MPARHQNIDKPPGVAVAPKGHISIQIQPPSLESALKQHQAGQLDDAEKTYRAILSHSPHHADALHLLGMLMQGRGHYDEAERFIRRAIDAQPSQAVFHCNLGIVLANRGKLMDAIAAYRTADSLKPDAPETLNNLGVAFHASGNVDGAISCFRRAFVLKPDYADARTNLLAVLKLQADSAAALHALGDILHNADRSADAVDFYRRAIELHPESAETYSNLGNALFAIGEPAEALLCYQQALKISPDFPQALNNLANALKEFDRLDDAIVAYRRAVELQPNVPEPLSNLGNALREAGRWELAVECYQQALAIRPDHAVTFNNIGNAYCERGQWSAAILAYENALAIKPDYADAINNLGTALEEIGQRDRAMQCYRRAMELTPKAVSPPWNIALLQLLQGDYKNGWPGYENRWKQKKQCKTWRNFKQPMLQNVSQMKGATILLHAEQGFGDAIQFCRYASMVADHGATVLLECPEKLVRLFSTLKGVSAVIARGDPLPDFDLHCPLMSLPMVFGALLEPQCDMPAGVEKHRLLISHTTSTGRRPVSSVSRDGSYLSAEVADLARWKQKFSNEPRAFRVGLVWAGQSTHQKDRHRSLSLADFNLLGDIRGVRMYSLQVGEHSAQAKSPPPRMQLTDWTDDLHDFADTAAMISQLDLVITVDTAVCHLAGALGKPVWVLLAFHPDWRWLLHREDSPWYPTARLFRQIEPANWKDPIQRCAEALKITATGFDCGDDI